MDTYLKRGAGILLPVSSLSSPYGIGTFGKDAYDFVDKLVKSGQTYWQVLPLGPTSFGDSPYAALSAFAGNPYYIDLDFLIDEGLITREFVNAFDWGKDDSKVSYGIIYQNRFTVLKEAYRNSNYTDDEDYQSFEEENEFWLDDYALYMSCKCYFNNVSWQEWDDDIRRREPEAIDKYQKLLSQDIAFWKFLQYKFYQQWDKLKSYANEHGILIIGDIPIYVAMDSADVWSDTEQFQLDKDLKPEKVAGVPPDAFSELGQRWGNPLYDWQYMEKQNFFWWRKRMQSSARLYDVIRIDHFIGIVRYYTIPAKDDDARNGEYVKGPGMKLIRAINESIGDKKIIAEDLGVIIPEVAELLQQSGYPGMKVLEFAFDGNRDNEHLPHNYSANCVVYGGTHDNETLAGYIRSKSDWELVYMKQYLDIEDTDISLMISRLFRHAFESVAGVVIFQMQDVMKLGNEARMNFPSTVGSNWQWRMKPGDFTDSEVEWIRFLTDIYGRTNIS
ncbi:MAG: 4-alpha-glucanotransferase [Eubacterium sp.]